jgi:hypothetical protein
MIDITQASFFLVGASVLLGVLLLVGSLAFFGVFVQRQFPAEVVKKKEERAEDAALRAKRSAVYRLGGVVLAGLALLTAVEYLFGTILPSAVILLLIGLFKAGLIVQYFMHVTRVWSEEGH